MIMSGDSNQEDRQAEQPLSLREALSEKINEQTKEVTEDADTSREEDEASEKLDEVTEEGNKEVTEEVVEEVKAEEPKPETTEESDVPNNWNAEEKKAFEEIPDEIVTQDGETISLKAMKDVVLNRNEELLKVFMQKSREVSVEKNRNKEWNNLLDPYKPQLTAAGMEPQQWIGSILKGVHNLQQNPVAVIKDLIGTYKVSATDLGLSATQSEEADDFHGESDPNVTKLETTVKDLQAEITSMKSAGVQRDNQSVQDEIIAFKSETDANGNLIHPHFDEARADMGILFQTGKAKTYQEAYDMSPTVRSKGLSVVKTDSKEALKKARAEAAKAKKAGKTVKTRSGQVGNNQDSLSLRDALKAKMRAQQ